MKRKRIFHSLVVTLLLSIGGLAYELGVPSSIGKIKGQEIEQASSVEDTASVAVETSSSLSSSEEETEESSSSSGEITSSESSTVTVGSSVEVSSSNSQTSSETTATVSSSSKEVTKSSVSNEKETSEIKETSGSKETFSNTQNETSPIRFVRNQTTAQFVAAVGEKAQIVAEEQDLYASVMLAQAILESASGNSSLASPPNYNLFGIKGSYQGNSASFATQEDNGMGQYYTIQADFRRYPSYKESLEDYAKLLHSSFYQGTWKSQTNSYQEATRFLTGRYATDTRYADKLNALIETYELTKYDKKLETVSSKGSEVSLSTEQAKKMNSLAFQNQVIEVEQAAGSMFPNSTYRLEKTRPVVKDEKKLSQVNNYKGKDILGSTRVN